MDRKEKEGGGQQETGDGEQVKEKGGNTGGCGGEEGLMRREGRAEEKKG